MGGLAASVLLDDTRHRKVCGICRGYRQIGLITQSAITGSNRLADIMHDGKIYSAHPRGVCALGYASLTLTLRDIPAAVSAQTLHHWRQPQGLQASNIARQRPPQAPDIETLLRGLDIWAAKFPSSFIGFIEDGGTKQGLRQALGEDNYHAHLVAYGWQCSQEVARQDWHLGNAHRDIWHSSEHGGAAVARLRALYAAKHAGKQTAKSELLPIIVKKYGHRYNQQARLQTI